MLRIPNKTLDDNYLLEDFQHDFNFLFESLTAVSTDAKTFGISGLASADDTDKIQEFLNLTGNLYFPEGTYNLSKKLVVKSNTTITAHPNAVFVRKHAETMIETETTESTTRYNGACNIRFLGGVYKHDGNSGYANVFTPFHAKDILFEGVTVLNTCGSHSIDIVGCKNIKIINCNFRGYIVDKANSFREIIQIDAAHSKGYPIYNSTAAAYDGQASEDIFIQGCVFEDSSNASAPINCIGQHGQIAQSSRHKNIQIINNVMKGSTSNVGSYGFAIRLMQMENVIIEGNTISGFVRGIFADISEKVIDKNGNELRGSNTSYPNATDENKYYLGNKNVTIANNIIVPDNYKSAYPGIYININEDVKESAGAPTKCPKHRGFNITGNTIYLPYTNSVTKQYGIYTETIEHSFINGNQIHGTGHTVHYGIHLGDYSYYNGIGVNYCYNISATNRLTISTNRVQYNRVIGKTLLWSGTCYTTNEYIDLLYDTTDFDEILVEIEWLGINYMTMDFSTSTTQSFRCVNLVDNVTSAGYLLGEMRIKKVNTTRLQLTGNKTLNPADNTIVNDSSTYYIKAIYGVNR